MESGKMVPEPICGAGTKPQTWRHSWTQPGERWGGLREGHETQTRPQVKQTAGGKSLLTQGAQQVLWPLEGAMRRWERGARGQGLRTLGQFTLLGWGGACRRSGPVHTAGGGRRGGRGAGCMGRGLQTLRAGSHCCVQKPARHQKAIILQLKIN